MKIMKIILGPILRLHLVKILKFRIREGCQKSKWKFKMAFAMKGGGLEGVSFAIKLF